jgi:hypothetical protein
MGEPETKPVGPSAEKAGETRPTGLSQEEKQKIVEWLKAKAGEKARPCPICGHTEWAIADEAVIPVRLEKKKIMLGGGPIYPLAMLVCMNCGNTQFLNLVLAGLFPPSAPPTGGGDESG